MARKLTPTPFTYQKAPSEKETRYKWGEMIAAQALNLGTNLKIHKLNFLIHDAQAQWPLLIEIFENLRVDWAQFKAEPLDIMKCRSNQLVECATDDEAKTLLKILKDNGREMYFNVDRKKGLYHIFGHTIVKIDGGVPTGYVALPFYLFQPQS